MYLLNAAGEAEWQRLKTHLAWSEGFLLGFIFSAHPQVIVLFRERLAAIYRARVTALQEWRIDSPAKMQEWIPRLLHPTHHEQALKAPIWLDLSHLDAEGESHWRKARFNFLARLNEQREPMRCRQLRPVILILPAAERAETKIRAPDLWAIRTFCLDTDHWIDTIPVLATIPDTLPQAAFPLSAYEQSLVAEWERLHTLFTQGRNAKARIGNLLQAGNDAFHALYAKRHLPYAQRIAAICVELAQQTPEALRDLSVSLDNVGKIAQALGHLDDARAAFDESLHLRRQILERVGETPEALRDLSVSLNNVGNTDQALGRLDDARAAFDESLRVCRQILERVGETPEALRDLSVSLENVGKIAQALGRLDDARAAFDESLRLRRQILERVGETPEALRDLSVSLVNVGRTDQALGRSDDARAAFDESLRIRRQTLERVGETPEALRDLSVSLNNVGNTDQALGRLDDARAAFDESLRIFRQIVERVGETPEALRDLSVSLNNVGKIAQALGRLDDARAAFDESHRIDEALLTTRLPHRQIGHL